MSEDKLREFIRQERDAFDAEEPGQMVWEKIHQEVHQGPQRAAGYRAKWAVAAGVAVLLSLAVSLYLLGPDSSDHDTEQLTEELDMTRFGDDLAEVDRYYSMQVGQHMERLAAYQVDQELMEEVDYLNEEFEALKEEMGQGIDDSKVVEALIENYRLRLTLLEDLLEAVETKNTDEDDDHEIEL